MSPCVVCPGQKPKETEHPNLVCFPCSNRILRHLRELEDYLPTLSLLKRVSGEEGRKSGFGSSSPANDTAIHHTDWRTSPSALDGMGAVATIHEWATAVRADKGIQPPKSMTLWSETEALRANHAWIICQPFVEDYADELREIHLAVRAAANDPIPRSVGRCISISTDRGECGGDVYELPDASGVKCSNPSCRRVYTGLDLDRLRMAQEVG
jgi:hypothetical protein